MGPQTGPSRLSRLRENGEEASAAIAMTVEIEGDLELFEKQTARGASHSATMPPGVLGFGLEHSTKCPADAAGAGDSRLGWVWQHFYPSATS